MNKSLLTNLIASSFIIVGYILQLFLEPSISWHWITPMVLSIGYFSLSGAVTNWLAVHMLFEKIPGLYGSGVIPLNFDRFKLAIRNMMVKEFFSTKRLQAFLTEHSSSFLSQNVDLDHLFDLLKEEILGSSFGGMLGLMGGASILEGFREGFKARILEWIETQMHGDKEPSQPSLSDIVGEKIIQVIDERLEELSPEQVKDIIQEMIRQHLGWLVVWGGLLGGLIGFLKELLYVIL